MNDGGYRDGTISERVNYKGFSVDEIADENPQLLVGKINVDQDPELAQKFGVASIPMLVVMKDGKIVNQSVGVSPKSRILSMLNS